MALGLVLQDIKVDLELSDTQLGLLTGIAFALFYSLMGIPIARWADRGNRVTIITLTTALWSGAVALCGLATTFAQLLAIRVAVAVGEAGCLPPGQSLIADEFARASRPRATSLYMLGAPLSTVAGYFLAGWLNELFGWRIMFVILGLPGLVIALLVWLTLSEPRNADRSAKSGSNLSTRSREGSDHPRLIEVLLTLWRLRTFRSLLLFFVCGSFFATGLTQWSPAFFIRNFGMKTGEVGTWFAAAYGIGGLSGTLLGGWLASRYAAGNERLQLRASALLYCAMGACYSGVYLSPNAYGALGLIAAASVMNGLTNGPIFATVQTLVPEKMRAMSIALLFLFANLVGLGLGPLAAGALSDALRPSLGDQSLRYALLLLCPGTLWCGWFLWRASRTVVVDAREAEAARSGAPAI
jgi:MFS family permease